MPPHPSHASAKQNACPAAKQQDARRGGARAASVWQQGSGCSIGTAALPSSRADRIDLGDRHDPHARGPPNSYPAADDERWAAVVARDKAFEGQFFYSVATTGIYCRPGCPARLPKRANVRFYRTRAAAEAAVSGRASAASRMRLRLPSSTRPRSPRPAASSRTPRSLCGSTRLPRASGSAPTISIGSSNPSWA